MGPDTDPMPFTTVYVRFSKLISVPKDATEELIQQKQQEMQQALERVRDHAETQGAWSVIPLRNKCVVPSGARQAKSRNRYY